MPTTEYPSFDALGETSAGQARPVTFGKSPPPPYGASTTGKRASSAKQTPHQWYHRRLSVWEERCSSVRVSPQVLAAEICPMLPTENTVSVDTALTYT